jgi:PrsW family intramembrane metalloprotease
MKRLFCLLPFLLPLWVFLGHENGTPFLEPSSLWPVAFCFIALGFFVPLGWWLFDLDPDARAEAWSRLGFGSIGGIAGVYLIHGMGPGLATKLFGAPVGLGIGVLHFADFLKDVGTLPLPLCILSWSLSVGLVEEAAKAFAARVESFHAVKVRCSFGYMSGLGFGLGEGLLYAYRDYAGVSDWTAYAVRFGFCVVFHGVMSAFAVLCLPEDWWDFDRMLISLLRLLPIALLHGAYDALLDRNLPVWAGLVATATFLALPLLLWWQQEQLGEV